MTLNEWAGRYKIATDRHPDGSIVVKIGQNWPLRHTVSCLDDYAVASWIDRIVRLIPKRPSAD